MTSLLNFVSGKIPFVSSPMERAGSSWKRHLAPSLFVHDLCGNRRRLFRIMQGDPKGPRRGSQADGAAWQLSGFCEHDLADVDIPRQESGLAIGEVVLPQSPESVVEPRWHQVGPSLAEIASPDRERLGIIFPEYVLANDGHAKALAELL